MNSGIVAMFAWSVAAGWLGAAADYGAIRRQPYKSVARPLSFLVLLTAWGSWADVSRPIARFGWYRDTHHHHLPRLETFGVLPDRDIFLRLVPALILTLAAILAPVYLSYTLTERRITRRQRR